MGSRVKFVGMVVYGWGSRWGGLVVLWYVVKYELESYLRDRVTASQGLIFGSRRSWKICVFVAIF